MMSSEKMAVRGRRERERKQISGFVYDGMIEDGIGR